MTQKTRVLLVGRVPDKVTLRDLEVVNEMDSPYLDSTDVKSAAEAIKEIFKSADEFNALPMFAEYNPLYTKALEDENRPYGQLLYDYAPTKNGRTREFPFAAPADVGVALSLVKYVAPEVQAEIVRENFVKVTLPVEMEAVGAAVNFWMYRDV